MSNQKNIFDHRFIFVTGKGGVGRTTISAAIARACAISGRKTLLATAFSADTVANIFETTIDSKIRSVDHGLDALKVDHREARKEYGRMILRLKPLYNAVFESTWVKGFLDAVPGLAEWAILGKVTHHALEVKGKDAYDTVVFDAPPTGHALEMIRLPELISKVIVTGRLHDEAKRRMALFSDYNRSCFVIVAAPDDLAAKEAIEASEVLKLELKLNLSHVVINFVTMNPLSFKEEQIIGSWPHNGEFATHIGLGRSRIRRCRREKELISEIEDRVAGFDSAVHLKVPYFPISSIGLSEMDLIAQLLGQA